MFENVLGQGATGQLIEDIRADALSRAMLFSGPPASGKGTAALELGRVGSCEEDARWNCACPACTRHRLLIHGDLLCLGRRNFSAEIAASAGAFLRETGSSPCRVLFIRSVRKLLLRFSPVLWEDDPKAGKVSPLVNSLEDELDGLDSSIGMVPGNATGKQDPLEKLVDGIKKDAAKLEYEGMGETIPIAQLRRAAWWCRLAPSGRGKLLVIENADRMNEEGRNSLLKLLEEPSARLRIVLTSARPGSLLPTILSRLRPYRFVSRGEAVEADVIKRVFRDKAAPVGIEAYLDSFLPVSADTLEALASWFAASVAFKAALLLRRQLPKATTLPTEIVLLGKHSAPLAEAAGLGRPKGDPGQLIAVIMDKAGKFEPRSLFSRFLCCLLGVVSQSQGKANEQLAINNDPCNDNQCGCKQSFIDNCSLFTINCLEMWAACCNWAESAVGTYNLRPAAVLEKLFTDLSRGMAGL